MFQKLFHFVLLLQQEHASIHPSHDLVPMSYNQSEYIQHLEAEVKLFKVYLHANFYLWYFFPPVFQPLYFFYFSTCLTSG